MIFIEGADTSALFSLCGFISLLLLWLLLLWLLQLVFVTAWLLLVELDELELLKSVLGRRSLCRSSSLAWSNENFLADMAKRFKTFY
jgi:hypothetical protein